MPAFLPMSSPRWAQQPCHADVGMCERGHLWLRFCLHCPAIRKEEGRLSHTLGKVLARCWHTQPYPLSMARAKEGREKGERRAREGRRKSLSFLCWLGKARGFRQGGATGGVSRRHGLQSPRCLWQGVRICGWHHHQHQQHIQDQGQEAFGALRGGIRRRAGRNPRGGVRCARASGRFCRQRDA